MTAPANPLLGAWQLVSMAYLDEAGNVLGYPYGEQASGYIMYAPDGHMAVLITSADRRGSDDQREQAAATAETCLAYAGPYDYQGDRVIHHLRVSLDPDEAGAERIRFIALDGDRLTLTSPPAPWRDGTRTTRIIWERVSRE
ncbi:MAG TPA: lipocalin-like domain-containing protein [Thermomicrobiales bacterium]|jgi:hypothetical protein|nr:lipocalin-like domain-containing protein [Thermomicrobiales bacterium]